MQFDVQKMIDLARMHARTYPGVLDISGPSDEYEGELLNCKDGNVIAAFMLGEALSYFGAYSPFSLKYSTDISSGLSKITAKRNEHSIRVWERLMGILFTVSTGGKRTIRKEYDFFEESVKEALKSYDERHMKFRPIKRPQVKKWEGPLRGCYFIGHKKDGPIKIGAAEDVNKRLAGIQTGSHREMMIYAVKEGDPYRTEREYHTKFSQTRIRGEWFKRTPSLMSEIERINSGS